jgi:hypothetical protein
MGQNTNHLDPRFDPSNPSQNLQRESSPESIDLMRCVENHSCKTVLLAQENRGSQWYFALAWRVFHVNVG